MQLQRRSWGLWHLLAPPPSQRRQREQSHVPRLRQHQRGHLLLACLLQARPCADAMGLLQQNRGVLMTGANPSMRQTTGSGATKIGSESATQNQGLHAAASMAGGWALGAWRQRHRPHCPRSFAVESRAQLSPPKPGHSASGQALLAAHQLLPASASMCSERCSGAIAHLHS